MDEVALSINFGVDDWGAELKVNALSKFWRFIEKSKPINNRHCLTYGEVIADPETGIPKSIKACLHVHVPSPSLCPSPSIS